MLQRGLHGLTAARVLVLLVQLMPGNRQRPCEGVACCRGLCCGPVVLQAHMRLGLALGLLHVRWLLERHPVHQRASEHMHE